MWNRDSGRKMGRKAEQYYNPSVGWVWLLLAFMICLLVVGVSWHGVRLSRDLQGAVPRQATGTVTSVVYQEPSPDAGDIHGRSLRLISVDGQPLTPNLLDPSGAPPLRKGDRVAFSYRVGRSGKWYLDQLSLVPGR